MRIHVTELHVGDQLKSSNTILNNEDISKLFLHNIDYDINE